MFAAESEKVPSSRIVLGKDIMEEVWMEMTRTRLPSWITPAPHNWERQQEESLAHHTGESFALSIFQ